MLINKTLMSADGTLLFIYGELLFIKSGLKPVEPELMSCDTTLLSCYKRLNSIDIDHKPCNNRLKPSYNDQMSCTSNYCHVTRLLSQLKRSLSLLTGLLSVLRDGLKII